MGVLRQAKFVDQNKGGPKIDQILTITFCQYLTHSSIKSKGGPKTGQILTKCDVGPKACRIGQKM